MEHKSKKILLILERDSYQKDAQFMNDLVRSLEPTGYRPVWYNPHGVGSSQAVTSNKWVNALPSFVRLPIKAVALLGNPRRLRHYLSLEAAREATIEGRCKNLKRFVGRLGHDAEIVVLSRSAGGRVSSLVADELGIKKLVCIGYPFRNPKNPVEPERFLHLEHIKTPLLIIQGKRDEYGGEGLQTRYELSPAVTVAFVDTDHDFVISKSQFNSVVGRIRDFIQPYDSPS